MGGWESNKTTFLGNCIYLVRNMVAVLICSIGDSIWFYQPLRIKIKSLHRLLCVVVKIYPDWSKSFRILTISYLCHFVLKFAIAYPTFTISYPRWYLFRTIWTKGIYHFVPHGRNICLLFGIIFLFAILEL